MKLGWTDEQGGIRKLLDQVDQEGTQSPKISWRIFKTRHLKIHQQCQKALTEGEGSVQLTFLS